MKRSYRGALLVAALFSACATSDKPEVKRDPNPAVAGIQDEIAKDTANWQLHLKLAQELRHQNRLPEAETAAQKAFLLEPSPSITSRLEMAKIYAAADRSASAINLVKEAEKSKASGEAVDEVKIAEVYAVLGDTVAVFRWLDRAVKANSPSLQNIEANADLVGVHNDPRWAAIAPKKP